MLNKKFKALVHFIIHQCRKNPDKLGSIRLNKVLWFTDMFAYQINGVSVTGETYIKREKGPVPATILATLEGLVADGAIEIQDPRWDFDSRKFISKLKPNTRLLGKEECELALDILGQVCDNSANEISEMTHDRVWEAACEGEEIPLYATLVAGKAALTDDVREWANSVIEKLEPSPQ